jgi:hypothetical protein
VIQNKESPELMVLTLLDRDTLGQIPGEIDVQSLTDGQPVCHELQRNDVDQALKTVNLLGHFDLVRLGRREFGVALVADDDGTALASNHLLISIERLGENVVPGEDHDNREVLIDESEDTMFEFARHDGLAMEIGDFLDLQCTYIMRLAKGFAREID